MCIIICFNYMKMIHEILYLYFKHNFVWSYMIVSMVKYREIRDSSLHLVVYKYVRNAHVINKKGKQLFKFNIRDCE